MGDLGLSRVATKLQSSCLYEGSSDLFFLLIVYFLVKIQMKTWRVGHSPVSQGQDRSLVSTGARAGLAPQGAEFSDTAQMPWEEQRGPDPHPAGFF